MEVKKSRTKEKLILLKYYRSVALEEIAMTEDERDREKERIYDILLKEPYKVSCNECTLLHSGKNSTRWCTGHESVELQYCYYILCNCIYDLDLVNNDDHYLFQLF